MLFVRNVIRRRVIFEILQNINEAFEFTKDGYTG